MISWEEKKYDILKFVNWQNIKLGTFSWKNHAENVHQKLFTDFFLILVNNPEQILCARNFFENKVFWKRNIKKPRKS